MREGVTYKRLGDLATFVNGYAFKPETWSDSGIPIIRIQNLNNPDAAFNYYDGEIPSKYVVEEGDLLISWSASLGAYFWNREKAYLNQHIFKVVFDKGDINKSYLKYAVEAQLEDMKRKAHGGTMQHIVKKDFDATPIPVPSLSDQELIVRELDSISSVISAKKQQVQELDNLAQAIFLDTFGDPISNPKGWEVKKMSEVSAEKLSYGSGASATTYDGSTRYVRITDIKDSGELNDDMVSPNVIDEKYILNDGDILFARSGATVGKTYLHSAENGRCIYAGYLIRLVPNKELTLPCYIFNLTKTEYYRLFIASTQRAVAQPNINAQQYGEFRIPLPPLSLQQAFAEKVQAIEKQKRLINQSIAEFESLLAQRMEFHFA